MVRTAAQHHQVLTLLPEFESYEATYELANVDTVHHYCTGLKLEAEEVACTPFQTAQHHQTRTK
jgi:hypothetical protein